MFFKKIIKNNLLPRTNINGDIHFQHIVKYSGNGASSDCLPLLIALHGDGDTAENFYATALDHINTPARIILIQAPISHEMGKVWPYSTAQYKKYGRAFNSIIAQLTQQYPTQNKPILFGFSGGGAMAYYQAVTHGNSYSYIFPISGLLLKEQLGDSQSNPSAKVYAYHGKTDDVVPYSAGITAQKLLLKNGVSIDFIPFNSGHHGLFSDMKLTISKMVNKKLKEL